MLLSASLSALLLFSLAFAADNCSSPIAAPNPSALPAIHPSFDFAGDIEKGLAANLKFTPSRVVNWTDNKMPMDCVKAAKEHNYGPEDFDVFEVHYNDCGQPWVMCRLRDAKVNATTMADVFGRMPLGMRQYVRHVIVIKQKDTGSAAAWNFGDTITLSEDCYLHYIFAHEISHSLDSHVEAPHVTKPGQGGLSISLYWAQQFILDDATISEYARTQWSENLAETGIIALYNMVVPGGVFNLKTDPRHVFHQFATYQTYYGDLITPGSKMKCNMRLPDSKVVVWNDTNSAPVPAEDHPGFKIGITLIPPGIFHNVTFADQLEH
ncbi:hypothetical protein F4804DRAFT_352504 [Jackrogersella minutella]|nr:hypothetical protein F4804DRAFT_352504 [Jackrogersella minutella]